MNIIDLTHVITENMPVYPGTEPPVFRIANTCEKDGFRESCITLYTHTGTHVDPPAHLFKNGRTLDGFPIDSFAGKATVIDCTDLGYGGIITMERINAHRENADKADFLLFRTGWDKYWGKDEYFKDYPHIDKEVAEYIVNGNKKGVGLDTISIDPTDDPHLPVHKIILGSNNTVIIENLTNLGQLKAGLFTFAAMPLKHKDADGSPVRAFAITD